MVRDVRAFTCTGWESRGLGVARVGVSPGWGGVVTLVEHWATTLGANHALAAPDDGHAGLTTGNPRWATMQWRDLPCIIRAHLSIRIKGYYA